MPNIAQKEPRSLRSLVKDLAPESAGTLEPAHAHRLDCPLMHVLQGLVRNSGRDRRQRRARTWGALEALLGLGARYGSTTSPNLQKQADSMLLLAAWEVNLAGVKLQENSKLTGK